MHILFVTELYPAYEGQPALEMNPVLHNFVREWSQCGHAVTVVVPVVERDMTTIWRSVPINYSNIDGINVHKIPLPKIPGFKHYIYCHIVDFARTLDFDVIVSHLQIGFVVGAALKRQFSKPLVYGVHRSDNTVLDIKNKNLKKLLFRQAFSKALGSVDGFSFRSDSVKREFLSNYDIKDTPYTVAVSGISSGILSPFPDFSYSSPARIVTCCSLIRQKHVAAVIDALANLPNGFDWEFSIIGDGPLRPELEDLVVEKGVQSRVMFTGAIAHQECIDFMRKADVFVMISETETFGMVYLEAMAQGLLTIGSYGTGIDGFISSGENGLLCPSGDSAALTKLLQQALEDKNESIRKAGYEKAKAYSMPKRAEAYLDFIKSVVTAHEKA